MSKGQTPARSPGFILHLFDLSQRQDRGALSELRRSLVSGNDILAVRHVLPWLTTDVGLRRESLALLVAGLYALHPERTTGTNFGHSMNRVWRAQEKRPSTEQRFIALLNGHSEDLPYHLRQAVSLISSHEVPIDWAQLYRDLCNWGHADRFVQRKWARSFWAILSEEENQPAIKED